MQKILFLYCSFFLLANMVWGQGKTYKEVKSLDKKLAYQEGEKIIVRGERTFLTVESWDKNYLEAKIEVISRHGNQAQAKADLEKIKIVFTKKGKTHFYSNAIQIADPSEKPKSNLKVKVLLHVPTYALLEIDNHFGKIEVKGPLKALKSTSDFTNISIHDFKGTAALFTKYGDTEIQNVTGDLTITADRSNLILQDVKSLLEVDIKYGDLDIYYNNPIKDHQIKAKHAPIKLHIPPGLQQNISLECIRCQITSNEETAVSNKKYNENLATGNVLNKGATAQGVIVSELEDINIIFETNQTSSN